MNKNNQYNEILLNENSYLGTKTVDKYIYKYFMLKIEVKMDFNEIYYDIYIKF